MKRIHITWLFGLVLAVLVLGTAAASASPVTYVDPAGDGNGAPDITSVAVSDTGNVLTFVIDAKAVELTSPVEATEVDLWLDTDANAATGDYDGTEYGLVYVVDAAGYHAQVVQYPDWGPVSAPSLAFAHTADTATFTIAASDLGQTSGFAFYAQSGTWVGDGDYVSGDLAPDVAPDTLWSYTLTPTAPVASTQPAWGPGALAGLLVDGSMYVSGYDMVWHQIDKATFAALGYSTSSIEWYYGSLPGTVGDPIPVVVTTPAVTAPVVPLAESVAILPKIGAPLPAKVVAGMSVVITFPVVNGVTGEKLMSITAMSSAPTVGGKLIRPHVERFTDGIASVGLKVPAATKAKQLKVKLTITTGSVTTTRIATIPIG